MTVIVCGEVVGDDGRQWEISTSSTFPIWEDEHQSRNQTMITINRANRVHLHQRNAQACRMYGRIRLDKLAQSLAFGDLPDEAK